MWEGNIDRLPFTHTPTGDWTCNPGMCPDGESNLWPFTLQDDTQPTQPHQSGIVNILLDASCRNELSELLSAEQKFGANIFTVQRNVQHFLWLNSPKKSWKHPKILFCFFYCISKKYEFLKRCKVTRLSEVLIRWFHVKFFTCNI